MLILLLFQAGFCRESQPGGGEGAGDAAEGGRQEGEDGELARQAACSVTSRIGDCAMDFS